MTTKSARTVGRPIGDHEARKGELTRATWRVIARRGLHKTSLLDIAHELQCTTGTLRHYFRSKAELLMFAKDALFDQVRSRMRAAAERRSGVERLIDMLAEGLPLDEQRIFMWRIYLAFQAHTVGDARLMAKQHAANRTSTEIFATHIRQLQTEGLIAPGVEPEAEAVAAQCFLDGLALSAIMAVREFTPAVQMKFLKNYVHRTFDPIGRARKL